MTIDCTTRLDEARTAYHQLMTGRRTASIGIGDQQVSYSRSDAGQLRAYIARLEAECGDPSRARRGGARFSG